MVHLCFHHGGSVNFVREEYVGGEVVDLGGVDVDYILTTVFHEYAKVRLHYLNVVGFVYKCEDDILDNGFSMLYSDKDDMAGTSATQVETQDGTTQKKRKKKTVTTKAIIHDGDGTSQAASEPAIPRHRTRSTTRRVSSASVEGNGGEIGEVNPIGEVGRHLNIFDWELDPLNDVLS
ncbi:hypothetical protein CJ030_MR2G026943 [Morella rubra]|uniref:PB1-like domain-containing protein n=1 Tax=Morella rubra TaxID=262757 RepID=A0A6A1WFC5_9ROSI|nr:hypothetical protein CJ030_MR2G026943 [Morella rubra]